MSRLNQGSNTRSSKLYNDNPNSDWTAGDLLVVLREHTICRASLKTARSSCFLKIETGGNLGQTNITSGTIVMALETQPLSGQLALVRVLHNGNIWVLNSNFVKRYKDPSHVLL